MTTGSPTPRHLRLSDKPAGALTVWIDLAGRSVNVFSAELVEELSQLIDRLAEAPNGPPVVFRSAKPGCFLAGADLKELATFQTADQVARFLERGRRMLDRLEALDRPTVAAIHGACLGGGVEFVLACRHRLARDDEATTLGLPETRLHLMPAWGGTKRLPRLVGLAQALRLMLSGQPVNSREAWRLGLVDAVVSADQFEQGIADLLVAVDSRPESHMRTREVELDPAGRDELIRSIERAECSTSGPSAAQRTVLDAVAAGMLGDTHLEERVIREQFTQLVLSPECREMLAKFLKR